MMENWIAGKRKHFLIWSLLLIYVFSANRLYIQYFLKNGKPERADILLPAESTGITYKITDLEPVRIDGENLYQLRGYAFFAAHPLQENKISIILSTPSHNLVFPTKAAEHPNMIASYKGFKKGMEGAEFRLLLSEQVLDPGVYQIGILLEGTSGGNQGFITTGSTIKRTPNTINYPARK
jgi:hypothetical protein